MKTSVIKTTKRHTNQKRLIDSGNHQGGKLFIDTLEPLINNKLDVIDFKAGT